MTAMEPGTTIGGSCDANFTKVRDELERNLRERGDVGASDNA